MILCTFLPRIIDLFGNKRKPRAEDHYDDAGKQILSEGLVPGKIEQFLMGARKNTTNYVAFMYRFAPVLVSSRIWNDSRKVHEALMNNRFDDILTVSDEAFMLVVMDNYIDPWHEKMLVEKNREEMVCTINTYVIVNNAVPLLQLTISKTQVTTESDGKGGGTGSQASIKYKLSPSVFVV